MAALTLRTATDADLPAVAALMNRAYRGDTARRGWTHEAELLGGSRTTVALLAADRARQPDGLLLWQEGEALCGCVWLAPEAADAWYLGSLTVDPDRQGAGAGGTLLAAAEARARDAGAARIRMTVIQLRTRLIAWYARRGYRATGETRPFPYGDERFGTPLRPDLHFVVLEKPLTAA